MTFATFLIPFLVSVYTFIMAAPPVLATLVAMAQDHRTDMSAFDALVAAGYEVRIAKNGRFYACRPGSYGNTFKRNSESMSDFYKRVLA